MNKRQEIKSTDNKEQEAKHEKKVIKTYKDLEVYKLSYKLAMENFWATKKFPEDELYSLTT